MTLSGVIALILRYFIQFDTFACPLHTVIEDTPVMSAKYPKYRIPVIFCQKWHTQQSHDLFATAMLLIKNVKYTIWAHLL